MNDKKVTKISRFLSLVLRHKPQVIGLKLDDEGWADVPELLKLINEEKFDLDIATLEHVVVTNNKKRFSFNEDKTRIRANQGHSVKVDLKFEAITPPPQLYHGTATRFTNSIFKQGLIGGSRLHVHLAADRGTAVNVGSRHGVPVVLLVNAEQMVADGHEFYQSENGVWLTNHVPVRYLSREEK